MPKMNPAKLRDYAAVRALEVAVAEAWAYVGEAIRRAPGLGGGHGPLDHGWPVRG